jgi:hypothetical protein
LIQIVQEMTHQLVVLVSGATADMAGDETAGRFPQGMFRR